ncbi:MAG TPA: SLC13 family permease, partial [Candidatus Thermoplasmatota archaeon]|nr:SLC13 family permease [Candidatus Thermoplasmatota archaeon]
KAVTEHPMFRPGQLDLLSLIREGKPIAAGSLVQAGDLVAIRARRDTLVRLEGAAGIEILSGVDPADVAGRGDHVAEIIVAPASSLVRRAITEGYVARAFGVKVLGIRATPKPAITFGFTKRLTYGDSLLVVASEDALQRLREHPDFVVASEQRSETLQPRKAALAVGIMAAVVVAAATGVASILVASLAGAVAMVLVRVLQPDDLWGSVRWDVVFLLAGMIPFGIALENTGIAEFAGHAVASWASHFPDVGVILMFYLASLILTMALSNAGTVILMVPIAFSAAADLGLSAVALVAAVMFAASNEFLTPIGYQTNLMVYGPGGYRFSDYARTGLPLALLLAVVTCAAIAAWVP